MLEVRGLVVNYGNRRAVDGVSFEIQQGEVVALLGANGAGKTTTLRAISGIVRPSSGSIIFEGRNVTRCSCSDLVKMGISQVPEGRLVFPRMTVRENLYLGADFRRDRERVLEDMQSVLSLFVILKQRMSQMAGTLSGGEQQMLAIARALMAAPKLLLLDEPSLGLAPILIEKVYEMVSRIRDRGMTLLLVEQNVHHALSLANRVYVLQTGRIVFSGSASEAKNNDAIKGAYLGM